ncbi:MAG TPA: metal-dependent hydrolase [Candidatus Bathyarchaeia archaeon]|nr:metal-dependent hydrolase [Candidatus Bathyarchaeia archaeon]
MLGHACWSYLLSRSTGQALKVALPAYLALLAGLLPDFDIYFRGIVQHHTITHSLLVLGPVTVLLSYFYGRLGLAFSIGLLSHLLTDSLVGIIPIFYPLAPDFQIGLNLGLPSLADTVLEGGALLLVILYALVNGDYKLVTRPSKDSVYLAIPLVSIITLTLLFAGDNNISLSSFAFSRKALTLISIGHIVLALILATAVLEGLIVYLEGRRTARPTVALG